MGANLATSSLMALQHSAYLIAPIERAFILAHFSEADRPAAVVLISKNNACGGIRNRKIGRFEGARNHIREDRVVCELTKDLEPLRTDSVLMGTVCHWDGITNH